MVSVDVKHHVDLLSKSTRCLTSTETIRLHYLGRGDGGGGRGGEGVWRGGKREIIHLSPHCHHQNDSCIKMGSDGSHFNVSFMVRDKITGQCPQTTTFPKRKESRSGIEPRSFCLPRAIVSWWTGSNQPHRAATGNVKTCVEWSTLLLFVCF